MKQNKQKLRPEEDLTQEQIWHLQDHGTLRTWKES